MMRLLASDFMYIYLSDCTYVSTKDKYFRTPQHGRFLRLFRKLTVALKRTGLVSNTVYRPKVQCVHEKKPQVFSTSIFYIFARIAIPFGKQHHECTKKPLVKRMSTSLNQCYFTLQNKKVAILLHQNVTTDNMQE